MPPHRAGVRGRLWSCVTRTCAGRTLSSKPASTHWPPRSFDRSYPGDRVGIWAPNCAEWTVTQFAAAKAGLILVNINPSYRLSELEFVLAKVGRRMLVTARNFKASDYIGMITTLAPETATCAPGELHVSRLPNLQWLVRLGEEHTPGFVCFEGLIARASDEQYQRVKDLQPVCNRTIPSTFSLRAARREGRRAPP
jgi:acyl-CoA synthetase (AMP-forming)/AMP-acid ligase II